MAGSIELKAFMSKLAVGRGIAMGMACQFILLPFLAFLSMKVFPQPTVTIVTLVIVCTSPGGGFSGLWCSLLNADLALSVAMTAASTLVCLVALPLNVFLYVRCMYGRSVEIDWFALVFAVVVVVSGVCCGLYVSGRWPGQRARINKFGQLAGVALMVLAAVTNGHSDKPVWENSLTWYVGICAPCVLGMVFAQFFSLMLGLSKPESVAVAIECCYQNTGLALTIALSAFPPQLSGAAAGVPFVYGIAELCVIPVFGVIAHQMGWTYAPRDENLCVAIGTSYQPSAERESDGSYHRKMGKPSGSSLRQLH
jgi:predicted Na+-dependent transporter